jgi:hypothetical protein
MTDKKMQEPVAWMTQARNFVHVMEFTEAEAKLYGWIPVYTTPPAQPNRGCGRCEDMSKPCDITSGSCAADHLDALAAPPAPAAFEVGLVEWVGNKLMATPKTTTTAPASWMEMVTANLVREGVNKHKARELAEHFYGLAPASQRQWVGLTDEEIFSVLGNLQRKYNGPPTEDSRVVFAQAIEAKLKEKNT